ncbi:MAG TPA: lycopene cyclase family protein, partial [Polyangiaceae bacterium]|nr:lycopene cyclase family protein [Polyangiaceae bacterium]
EIERLSRSGKLAVLCDDGVVDVDTAGENSRVTLASGRQLSTPTLVDARGPDAGQATNAIGFQKFVGLELEVELGSAPTLPLLIDARVPQRDGFRFVYVLPLASTRVLVEDTTFADGPELDVPRLREEIRAYAASAGLRVRAVVRQELGVLPLPSRATAAPTSVPGVIRAGYQGGFFHPTTGYSFPLAVRLAATLAASEPSVLRRSLAALARREARQQRYAALLNRLLFRGFAPEERRNVLERFYRLPAATVRRFYALRLTPWDRARILCGRPPRGFSVTRFLRANERALLPAPGDPA